MLHIIIMSLDQPREAKKSNMASNQSYFAYSNKRQKKYVKSRIPAPVQYRVKKARTQMKTGAPVLKVAECTAHYLKAVMDPFDTPAGACLPADLFPLPSQKVKAFCRGTCVLGTTGYGYVNAAPSPCNDATAASFTTATSVMASNTAISAVTNIGTVQYAQLPWTTADVVTNNLVQARLVALGLRVRYAGTEANRNGILNFYEDADHASLQSFTYDSTRQRVNTYSTRPPGDGSWSTVVASGPVAPLELEYQNSAYLTPTGNAATLICFIKGVAGDVYEFEVFEHIEAIGVNTIGRSPSHADPQGYPIAQQVAKQEAGVKSLAVEDTPSVIHKFIQGVIRAAPFVIEQGSNIMKALGGDPMAALNGLSSSAGMIMSSLRGEYGATAGMIGNRAVRPALGYK